MLPHSLLAGALVVLACAACAQAPEAVPGSTDPVAAARPAPYPCDGCEVVRQADVDRLDARVVMAGASEPGERLVLSGRVLHADGKTPAPGIVLYLHQTGADGRYRQSNGGHALQGWLVTDAEGRYWVDTIRPGPYPSGGMPAHIHVYVGEPGRAPYYLNDYVFEGDREVTRAYLDALLPSGDTGVVALVRTNGAWSGERDLVLVP